MKKFLEKQPVLFSVMWIIIYVVGMSLFQNVSESIGVENLCEAIFCGVLTVILLVIAKKYKLFDYLGLKKSEVSAVRMLIYVPLALVAFSRLFMGVGFVFTEVLLLRTVKMLFVGFVEEIVFRGFLFKGMIRESKTRSVTPAIVVSALTFGLGHIVNLIFNGYEILDSACQIAFAVACGFMLVMIYVRTDSLIACIIFHSLNNISTGYADMRHIYNAFGTETGEIVWAAVCIVVMLVYTLYVVKFIPKREVNTDF